MPGLCQRLGQVGHRAGQTAVDVRSDVTTDQAKVHCTPSMQPRPILTSRIQSCKSDRARAASAGWGARRPAYPQYLRDRTGCDLILEPGLGPDLPAAPPLTPEE